MISSRRSVLEDSRGLARRRLRDLIAQERERARLHIDVVKRSEPDISKDRLARLLLERWTKVAKVEGGLTGMLGLAGVPLNLMLFTYCQLAVMVAIAEAYGIELRGDSGEEALVDVLGRVHGIEDVIRSSPRVLGVLARALAIRHGLGAFGRIIPLLAVPFSMHLNAREMQKVGEASMRRFGNVIFLA